MSPGISQAARDTDTVDPRIAAIIHDVLIASPVARHLAIQVDRLAPDDVRLRLPFDPANVTIGRIVHGGVIATLADIAGAAASASGADPAGLRGGATQTLVVHYLRPADGVDLVTETTVLSRSRGGTVTAVSVRDTHGHLVAQASVTSRIW